MAVCFTDIQERDLKYRQKLVKKLLTDISEDRYTVAELIAVLDGTLKGLPSTASAELETGVLWLDLILNLDQVADPLLKGLAESIGFANGQIPMRWTGDPLDLTSIFTGKTEPTGASLLPNSHFSGRNVNARKADLTANEALFVAVAGILERERAFDRTQGLKYSQAVQAAIGEYRFYQKLYTRSLRRLSQEGDGDAIDRVRASDWAGIVDSLAKDKISDADLYFDLKVTKSLDGRAGSGGRTGSPHYGGGGAQPSWINISLPNLEDENDLDIVEDNLKAMQVIYFASTLEDLRFFQVMDKLLELFNIGVLPFGKGPAGDKVYAYWKANFDRFTEVERYNLYTRALGKPGGEVGSGTPNREFNDLWLRFISSVSEWRRQNTVDRLLRASIASPVSDQQVRKSGRDLAANLSLYGYGIAWFVATDLQQQIRDIIDVFGDDEVRAAYGARDMWQVVDQVATLELGGARNSVRYRTMANSGAIIIRWLAQNTSKLTRVGYEQLLTEQDLYPPTDQRQRNPLEDPTAFDLITACEEYLAVTGTPDERVGEFAQPSLGPDVTSRPVRIPGFARDVLDSMGVEPIGSN